MSVLHVVALLVCINGRCDPEVLTNEVYDKLVDCQMRAAHLMQINPGKEFVCGTVQREKQNDLRPRRTDSSFDDRSAFGADHFYF